jgi:hypothetical protein
LAIWPSIFATAEILPLEELHHHVGVAAVDPVVVGLDDVRAPDLRRRAGLPLEADLGFVELIGPCTRIDDELDSDLAPEPPIEGNPQRAHPATGKLAIEAVLAGDDPARAK